MAGPEDEFRLLMARVRTGCPEAARELFNLYGGHIRRVVRRKLHQDMRAQYDSIDFIQDVWASFFTNPLEKYTLDTPEALVAFLSEVASHKVMEAFRRRFQTQKYNAPLAPSLAQAPGTDPLDHDPPVRGPTPSQVAIANEHWEQLLEGQPKRFRLVLELLRQGYHLKEVAEQTGVHRKMIQRLLHKLAQRRDIP